MRFYVLTRSSFAPEVDITENRHRLLLLEGITAPCMAAQTDRDITWLVMVNLADPLLEQRRAAFESSGLRTICASSEDMAVRGWADAPWGPWARHIEWDGPTLTFRLDDDDGLTPGALASVRAFANDWQARQRGMQRTVITLPVGYRIWQKMSERVWLKRPMSSALYAPPGDQATICDVSHLAIDILAPIREATQAPSWIWVRHSMTRSTYLGSMRDKGRPQAPRRTTDALRAMFPVDWRLIEGMRAVQPRHRML